MNNSLEPLTLDECKIISLDILIDVDKFCRENNITYYIGCGTLLGAIRHKGYIPWDDDIDILMPRPDYERFLKEYKGKYKLYKPDDGRLYYAKVYDDNTIKYDIGIDYKKYKPLGVDIDVFPLDGMVNDENIINKLYIKECALETLLRLSNQPVFYRKNPLKAINRIIPRIIGSKNIEKLIEKNAKTYDYDKSDYVIRMRRSTNGFTGALKKDVYNPPVEVEFEGYKFYAPNKYDEWLKRFFGENYMELPPIEKQKSHHFESYRKK